MSDDPAPRSIRIDAHHHFWPEPDPALYPWMTDQQAALRRPFGPDDLRPLLQRAVHRQALLEQHRGPREVTLLPAHAAQIERRAPEPLLIAQLATLMVADSNASFTFRYGSLRDRDLLIGALCGRLA